MSIKKIYDFFSYGLISKELTPRDKSELRKRENAYVKSNIKFIAILFIIIQFLYAIDGIVSRSYEYRSGIVYMIALIIVLASSVLILFMAKIKNKKIEDNIQHIAFGYYILLNLSMLLLLIHYLTIDSRYLNSIYFLYIILVICPIPILIYDILVFLFVLIGSTIILLSMGRGLVAGEYTLLYSMIFLGLIAVLHVRMSYFKGFYHDYKESEANKRLERISTTDFLTSLPNRTALNNFIKNELEEVILFKRTIGLAMIDIDNFKSYNDFYSHLIGDNCLKSIAGAIDRVTSKYNMNSFRYGGEEFLIIDTDSSKERMEEFSKALLNEVINLNLFRRDLDDYHKVVTVSIGAATIVLNDLNDYDEALKAADDNLYNSKNNGKNCYTLKEIRKS